MDLPEAVPLQSSPNLDRKEPGELLDESWFFGNLLERKPRMARSYSDGHMIPVKSMEETFSSINRIPSEGKGLLSRAGKGLMKTPSMPPIKQGPDPAEMNAPSLRSSLLRAPSLPTFADMEEVEDDESDFCMGRLIRQASLNQSRALPPRQTPKGLTRVRSVSTIPKQGARQKSEPEDEKHKKGETNKSKTRKGHSSQDLDEELHGFKNFGLNSQDHKEKESRRGYPSKEWLAKSFGPPLQSGEASKKSAEDKKGGTNKSKIRKAHSSQDFDEELQGFKNFGLNSKDHKVKESRRSYPSEAWLAKSFGPPLQSGEASKKSAEDKKAQIKFWARAVASNVRQEC